MIERQQVPEQENTKPKRRFNTLVNNPVLEDYSLRYAPRAFRKWSEYGVATAALGFAVLVKLLLPHPVLAPWTRCMGLLKCRHRPALDGVRCLRLPEHGAWLLLKCGYCLDWGGGRRSGDQQTPAQIESILHRVQTGAPLQH